MRSTPFRENGFSPTLLYLFSDDFAMDICKKNAPLHNVLPVQQGYLY